MFEVIDLGGMKTVTAKKPCHHVYVVDCSYSMYESLPKMKEHLKNVLSLATNEQDIFSLIYFSSRNKCGTVCSQVPMRELGTVETVKSAIDRWLTPMGSTSFTEPFAEAIKVVGAQSGDFATNFVMLTDGYDNNNPRNSILDSVKPVGSAFDSCSFIEFGWYCDRDLIEEMALTVGGLHLFAESFTDYRKVVEKTFSSDVSSQKIKVQVNKKATHAVYVNAGEIFVIDLADKEGNVIFVPDTVDKVHSVVASDVFSKQLSVEHLLLIGYYGLKTNNNKLTWRCLEKVGDINLIDMYSNAFTRQEISAFTESLKEAVLDESKRFVLGRDENYAPKEDELTVVQLIEFICQKLSGVRIETDSKLFNYSKIGRGRKHVDELPMFVATPGQTPEINGIVTNASRPNVSIRVVRQGSIKLPENDYDLDFIPSQEFKSYTVVRDGLINIKSMPLIMSESNYNLLEAKIAEKSSKKGVVNVISRDGNTVFLMVNFDKLPVVNRDMAKEVKFEHFKNLVACSHHARGLVKGFKSSMPKPDNKVASATMKTTYGEEAANWLASIGYTDRGLNKKTESVEATDFYNAVELSVKVKGLSGLPSLNAVQKKLDAKKALTVSEQLVYAGVRLYEETPEENREAVLKQIQADAKTYDIALANLTYSIILSKGWFTFDENEPQDSNEVAVGEVDFSQVCDPEIDKKATVTVSIENKQIAI